MSKTVDFGVGKSAPQIEAQEKVCGSAQFIADLYRPNMLFGAVLQSPHAHARILNYDLSQALAMTGVRGIVTGDDLQQNWRMGAFIKDEHALAKGKVRYVGEPVAAVAADTEAIARAAAAAINVTYEELPAALSPEAALSPGAAVIHEEAAEYLKVFEAGTQDNLCSRTSFREGDIERGWRDSDLIFEARYQTQPQAHVWQKWMQTAASRCGRRTNRYFGSKPTSPSLSACRCRGCVASPRASAPVLATRWNRTSSRSRCYWR